MYFVMKTDSSGTALRMTKDIKRHTERSIFIWEKFLLKQESTCNSIFI